jgi:hypothetical protein
MYLSGSWIFKNLGVSRLEILIALGSVLFMEIIHLIQRNKSIIHLMSLKPVLIGAGIAWASTELPTRLDPLAASLLGALTTAALAWLTPLTRQYGLGEHKHPE